MAQCNVKDLTGAALDYAVAMCEGKDYNRIDGTGWTVDCFNPSTDWSHGGPIIGNLMRNCRAFFFETDKGHDHHCYISCTDWDNSHGWGPTLLIAVMRCYVVSKFGDMIEIPDQLL